MARTGSPYTNHPTVTCIPSPIMPDASVATTTAQVITLAARPTPLPTDHTLPRLVPRTKLQVKFQPTARTTFELGSLSHRNYPSMDDLLALPAESVVHWALAGQSPPDLERGVDLASDLGVRAFAACIRLLGMCHSHWDVEWKNMVPVSMYIVNGVGPILRGVLGTEC